jgi:hypothetical protein
MVIKSRRGKKELDCNSDKAEDNSTLQYLMRKKFFFDGSTAQEQEPNHAVPANAKLGLIRARIRPPKWFKRYYYC